MVSSSESGPQSIAWLLATDTTLKPASAKTCAIFGGWRLLWPFEPTCSEPRSE